MEKDDFKIKILESPSLRSLVMESKVYNELIQLGWQTSHSPYFVDTASGKLRELDIKARKHYQNDKFSCDIDVLIECKSLSGYNIVAGNEFSHPSGFDMIWTGNYTDKEYNNLDELLIKFNITTEEINYIKEKLWAYCYPDNFFRWYNYRPSPFLIPNYNTYREMNFSNVKDNDNSVIWKAILSLQSAIAAHENLLLENIRYSITEIVHQSTSRINKIEQIVEEIILRSDIIYFTHPVIVVESNLWALTEKTDLVKLKYFRLNIQKMFEDGLWVDIVQADHFKEYFKNLNKYNTFFKRRKFKSS